MTSLLPLGLQHTNPESSSSRQHFVSFGNIHLIRLWQKFELAVQRVARQQFSPNVNPLLQMGRIAALQFSLEIVQPLAVLTSAIIRVA